VHIGFVALDYPSAQSGGGVGNQVQVLGRALVRAGHRVTVVALAKSHGPLSYDDQGVHVQSFSPGNWHWYVSRLPLLGSAWALAIRELEYARGAAGVLRQSHRRDRFDLIEITETGGYGLDRLDPRLPIITRLHGEQYTFHRHTPGLPLSAGIRLGRRVQRLAIRSARLLISPSAAHALEVANELGLDPSRIKVVPNCIEPKQVDNLYQSTANPSILFVGRLERCKGVLELLQAVAQVVAKVPQATLLLAGAYHPSLPKSLLEDRIRDLGLNAHVRFLGHLESSALADVYRQAALCVLPSYYETFGVAALEAMAFGVPAIGTSGGALSEVIDEGVTGRLVPPGDPPALGRAILALLEDQPLRTRMGQAARQRAESYFNVERILDLNLAIYRSVMEGLN
jgi:glycosyltransferase involved in cell wall biosynthesis